MGRTLQRRVTVSENTALFILSVSMVVTAPPELRVAQEQERLSPAAGAAIQALKSEVKRTLDTLVGAYALYLGPARMEAPLRPRLAYFC